MTKAGYIHRRAGIGLAAVVGLLAILAVGPLALASARRGPSRSRVRALHHRHPTDATTATPIKHLVVVFQENRSFDRYCGTYPYALNPPGEPQFVPAPDTPTVNGLTPALLTHNPNLANPVRLGPDVGNTCGSNHQYLAEQKAYDMGLVDRFVEETGPTSPGCDPTKVMDYYDGNTVTGLWNYAQHFSMSDNSFGTTFGPSHVGAVNLVSGNNHGAVLSEPSTAVIDRDPDRQRRANL
jgi:phospholipase C